MTRTRKWLVGAGIAVIVLAAAAVTAVALIPSDEALARHAELALEDGLGVPVTVGAVRWALLPVPSVVIEDTAIRQAQPIRIRQLIVYPDLTALLLHKKINIRRAEIDGAIVPQLSMRGLGKSGGGEAKGKFTLDAVPLARFVFSNVSWISRTGIAVVYAGEIDFEEIWRPRTAQLRRPDFQPLTELRLTRRGGEDKWDARINVGGGTLNGALQLHTAGNGAMRLEGKLKPEKIEVQSALRAFNRKSVVSGLLAGDTTLSAEGSTVGELAQSLKTVTPFTMGKSSLVRFDLDKAIRTLGKAHDGQTPLDSITGTLETQNTKDGMIASFKGIAAKSGSLSATGDARLFNRRIDAEFAVDLVSGLVGVPVRVNGPVNDVSVSVPGGAVAGAVVGTAVLPGVGTVIGARIGAAIGKIFNPEPAPKATPLPPQKSR